ncbi:OLC1v1027016C1 [Oldenlandia corymbosa var. corymbosa]|uniref:OLC1v1027016C1 n=1 Tax=Oldenlandia corymbosa var. corymbosa TaxID=529605 RepID=A0AAV1CAF0_OLDCO|nr:OLC1v1027016C1 [Oldenlandia corymbosa var. corymbosa]
MTTQTAKIRLVKCPRCRHLLPEPEIPVYKCGGCGAVLQAKIRRTNTQNTVLNHDRSDATGEGRLDSIQDEKRTNGPTEEAPVSEKAESSSDSGSNGKQVNGLIQETSSERGEHSVSNSSTSNQDYCMNKETTARGESSSIIDSNGSEDTCQNPKNPSSAGKPDVSNERKENGFHDYNEKMPGDQTFSPEPEDQELTAETKERVEQFVCDYTGEPNSQDYENDTRDSDRNCISGGSFSEDFYSSVEFLCHETEGSSPEQAPNISGNETNRGSGQVDRVDQTESKNCMSELPDHHNFLSELSSPHEGRKGHDDLTSSKGGTFEEGGEDIHLARRVGSNGGCKSEDHQVEFSQDANSSNEVPLSTDIVPSMSSPRLDADAPVNDDIRVQTIKSLEKKETGSLDADENPINGRILSDNVDSFDDLNLGASQRLTSPAFEPNGITDSPDSLPGGSSAEFDPKHRVLSKSPTKCYYGHDSSASSYDGFEDKIPNRLAKPPRRKFKAANSKNSNGLHKEDGPWANDSQTENLEMQYKPTKGPGLNEMQSNLSEIRYQARKPPIMPEKSHPTMKYRTNLDNLHDPRSSGLSIGSRMREDKDEHISTVPFIPMYLQTGQRKASTAPYSLDSFKHYSAIGSSDVPSYAEPDKMELLRMVNELKEELSRIQISNSRFPLTVAGEDMYTPTYYNHHLRPLTDMPSNLSYSRYARRYSQERGLAHLNQPSRMAFSGDAADYMRHVDCACLNCHPQDWHYSVQLPSHTVCCNKVHCRGHSNNCYNSPCSTSSSPHRCKSSEFSVWDHDTMSGDQRHRDSGIRDLQLKERYQSKRHVRPVAGGNPIIACYNCSALLQLPADFLLLGRRYHKLRCNACGKVLKFALQSGKHIVPSIPEALAPPPSMVDYSSESIARGNHASAAHSLDNVDVDPVSFSEDYGVSFERSYSTEADPSVLPPPRHLVERNSCAKKKSSGDTVTTVEDRKMKSVMEYQKMPSKSLENFGAMEGEPSSRRSKGRKSSSEIKEISGNGGSPLHRLMGYSSPSAVMKN